MQQMTRKEYKAFMSKWRAVLANLNVPDSSWKRDKSVQDAAFNTVFGAVYELIPVFFWECKVLTPCKLYRKPIDKNCISMNSEAYCPNSYPHATRNP
jgi:hypothetical protein